MRKTLEDYPNLVKEFDFKKNTPFTPKDFAYASNKKVWWKCIKSHEWKTKVSDRTDGKNCLYCSGKKVSKENNLKLLFPDVAKEWNFAKNGNLKPEDVTKASGKKVWWKCIKGHEWLSIVSNRIRGTNCPHCFAIKRKSKS